jgi:hypothetical protein
MVPRDDLPTAVAMNSMGFNVARSLGTCDRRCRSRNRGTRGGIRPQRRKLLRHHRRARALAAASRDRLLPRERLLTAMLAGVRYVAMSPNIKYTLLRGAVYGIGASALILSCRSLRAILSEAAPSPTACFWCVRRRCRRRRAVRVPTATDHVQ